MLQLGPTLTRYSTIWPNMDPAHSTPPRNRLENIEQALQQQDARFTGLEEVVRQVLAQLGNLTAAHTQAAAAAPSPAVTTPAPASPPLGQLREPPVGIQERYEGDPEGCSPFLTNCSILFALQPYTFATEEARVAYAITHLTGRARLWGTAEWEGRTPACSSFQVFASELQRVFGVPSRGPDHHDSLFGLRQGGRTVADYSIDFRTRVHRSGWNTVTQCDAFLEGLNEYVKDGLVPYDLPRSLNELIELSTRVDGRIQARRRERRQGPHEWRSPVSRPAPPTQPSPCRWVAPASRQRNGRVVGKATCACTVARLAILCPVAR